MYLLFHFQSNIKEIQSFLDGALDMSSQVHPLPVNINQRKGMRWALQPVLFCMRLCGVMFRYKKDPCPFSDWFLALLLLVVNVVLNLSGYILSIVIYNYDFDGGSFNTTTSLNNIIDYSNFLFYNIGGHYAIVFSVRFKWAKVVKTFSQIERSFQLQQHQYDKLRKNIILGLVFFIQVNKNCPTSTNS